MKKESSSEIENIKEEVKKRIPGLLILLLVVFIIALILFFFLGIKIKFILNDEIQIELSPTYNSFSVHYSESPEVNFTIKTNNFKFCDAFCEYRLLDLSTNEVLHSSNKTIVSNQAIMKRYTFPINEVGSGQKIYLFEVECNNIKTNICSTEQEKNYKSSFIVINYDISDDEMVIKEEAMEELPLYLDKLKESEKALKQSKVRTSFLRWDNIPMVPEEVALLQDTNKRLEREFASLSSSLNVIRGLWNEEDYFKLGSIFNSRLKSQILSYESKTKNQSDMVNKTIQLYNNIINKSLSLISNQGRLNEIYNYYIKTSDNRSKSIALYFEQTSNILLELEKGQITRYNNSYMTLKLLEEDFYKLENDYLYQKAKDTEEFINYTKKALNISFFNESMDYCLVVEHTFCSNLTLNDSFAFSFSLAAIEDVVKEIEFETNATLAENYPQCCAFNRCMPCCMDCQEPYPVIFLHGHLFNEENSPETSLKRFSKLQRKLMDDSYINAGQIDIGSRLEEIKKGELGAMPFPITVRVSYYYISYYDFGSYRMSAQKSDRIENYAIRLKEIIELIKEKTGREKVDIVAHSMGGLVARDYLTIFGEEDINKLILIGTPNHGIKGKIKSRCSITGSSKSCQDMVAESIFLKRLNSQRNIPAKTKLYTISAKGCDMEGEDGDGIVAADSVLLEYAENFVINGTCTDFFNTNLHSKMLDTDLYPETYEIIKNILSRS